ncbi:MAG: ABC transporter permease [Anaerolineae bacterium]|nr:ABC transporter permease [Anaerolineae bacterium]
MIRTSTLATSTPVSPPAPRRRTWRVWRRLLRSPQGLIGGLITLVFAVTALVGPRLAPYSPTAMQMSKRLAPPSPVFWLGTDDFGRDILSRILHGAGASFQVGLFSVGIALVIGTLLGVIVGLRGGLLDTVVMNLMDVLFAFPAVLLAIAIMAVLGATLRNVILAIGIVSLPVFVRLARGSTLGVRNLLYIEAAHSIGQRAWPIAVRHILPNIMAPLIVQASLTIAAAILTEAALSYLGLGNPPPAPSWGNMLSTGYQFMQVSPWPAFFPGFAIMIAVLGFNLLGDGLRDALDPTLRIED